MKINFIWQDWVIIAAIVLNLLTAFMLKFTISSLTAQTQAATYIEQNPEARKALESDFQFGRLVVAVEGFTLGLYIAMRHYRDKSPEVFTAFAFMLFWIHFSAWWNDLPGTLRLLLG